MLSPNTLLNKARYRVEGLYLGGQQWNVYAAVDQTIGTNVLVVEYLSDDPAPTPEHGGLVKFTDRFVMNGRRYGVTEPVEPGRVVIPPAKVWNDFAIALMALNSISAFGNKRFEIGPTTVVTTSNPAYKLLPLEPAQNVAEIEAWNVPIEKIWGDLDHISQKAIYNSWDESAIADLEQPLDQASDLYSLASVFYRNLTGATPASAFERTVVGMDESDPLVAPEILAPELGNEASAHLLRCLELRRENRFSSFEQAIMTLPTIEFREPQSRAEEDDELLDLGPPSKAAVVVEGVIAKVETVPPVKYELDLSDEAYLLEPALEVPAPGEPQLVKEQVPIFTLDDAPRRRSGLKLAMAGVVVAAAGGIGWGTYQFSQSAGVASTPVVSAQVAAPIQRMEPVATPSPLPNEDPAVAPVKASSDMTVDQQPTTSRADEAHPKQPAAAAKATTKPASTSDAKAKKKVTVDDLINDN